MNNAKNELSWQDLQLDWLKQEVPTLEDSNIEKRLNNYFKIVRKKERVEIFELFIDVIIGGLIIWGGIALMQTTFEFFWPLPTEEVIKNYQPRLFSMHPNEIFHLFVSNLIVSLGLIGLGISIPALSLKYRFAIFKKDVISSRSSKAWIGSYFDSKIKQTNIGRWFAIGFLSLTSLTFVYTRFIQASYSSKPIVEDSMMNSADINLLIARLAWFIVFPAAIYWIATWQRARLLKEKAILLAEE